MSSMGNKKSTTLLIVSVTLGILAALGMRLWSTSQAKDITGPTSLRLSGDGKVYAMTGQQLLVFTPDGGLADRIPLSRFGLDEFVGDFWVNERQEILLRAQRPDGGIGRWLRVLQRIGGDGGDQMPAGQAALQWCPLAGGACRPFGPDFRSTRTFGLTVEASSSAVLIADTAQHRLLRLEAKGQKQATSGQNFKFPNAMVMGRDGLLYVTDTNHHRIEAVSPGIQDFGTIRHGFGVVAGNSSPDRRWPMDIIQTPDGAFWTINANGNMAFGDVMVYEEDGRARRKLDLPPGTDPLSLLLVKDRVLVADPRNFQIATFDLQGNPRRSFGDDAFAKEMKDLQRLRQRHETISAASLAFIVALALAAFVIQRRQHAPS